MRVLLTMLFILTAITGAAFADTERPKVDSYTKAFAGGEGIELYVLGIGKSEDEEFLIKFSGINHEWDRKIFKAKKVNQRTDGSKYVLQISPGEKSYNPVHVSNQSYQIYLPGGNTGFNGVHMSYDKGLSRSINPQHFLTEYLEQVKK